VARLGPPLFIRILSYVGVLAPASLPSGITQRDELRLGLDPPRRSPRPCRPLRTSPLRWLRGDAPGVGEREAALRRRTSSTGLFVDRILAQTG
jgi:hypothetical protein